MSVPEFGKPKTALFLILFLLLAVAGLFGYGDFVPSPEGASTVNAVVALVAALVGLYATLKRT